MGPLRGTFGSLTSHLPPCGISGIIVGSGTTNLWNYGNYGKQSGDGKSSISSSKQQTITIDAIVKFIRENGKENTK